MKLRLTNRCIHLRNITAEDEAWLCQIYSSTRTEELAQLTDWLDNQKEIFLRSQFLAQHSYYQTNYRGAHFWIIEYRFEIIGRLYIHPSYQGNSLRIIDISLLPEWRNRGIGKQVLLDVMSYAEAVNRPVTIHVETFNPAMKLYKRLGFELLSETNGVYHLLEWKKLQPLEANN